jgi:HEPN domain-containing protein
LNSLYKKENFAPNLLESQAKEYSRHSVVKAAKDDFLKILRDGREAIVLELLSFYAEYLFGIKKDENLKRKEGEPEALYIKRNIDWKLKELDEFREVLNNIFEQFELNIHLTRAGFVYRNSKAIAERVYEPVLDFLMGEKWREVQRDMKDAFDDFRKGEHSDCITHAVSALQAFLQVLVTGKTGKGDISTLIPEAQKNSLIPDDAFSSKMFKDIKSILMEERQAKGNAHPKKEYATEQHARLILNLVMVFIQHCISTKSE